MLNKQTIPGYLKNYKRKFGNLESDMPGYKSGCLPFGIKQTTSIRSFFATHGFIKKVDKVPANEIERAENIRKKYFETKNKK